MKHINPCLSLCSMFCHTTHSFQLLRWDIRYMSVLTFTVKTMMTYSDCHSPLFLLFYYIWICLHCSTSSMGRSVPFHLMCTTNCFGALVLFTASRSMMIQYSKLFILWTFTPPCWRFVHSGELLSNSLPMWSNEHISTCKSICCTAKCMLRNCTDAGL